MIRTTTHTNTHRAPKFAHPTRPEVAGQLAESIARDLLGLTERDIGAADGQIEVKSVEGHCGIVTLTAEQLLRKRQGWFVLVRYDRPRDRRRDPDGKARSRPLCTVVEALKSRALDIAIVDGAVLLNAIADKGTRLEARRHADGRALPRWYWRLAWGSLALTEHRAIDDGERPVTLWRHADTDPEAIDTLAAQAASSRRNLFAPWDGADDGEDSADV